MLIDPSAPDRSENEAAFFFPGALEPAELANFQLSNVLLPGEDAVGTARAASPRRMEAPVLGHRGAAGRYLKGTVTGPGRRR